MLCCTLVKRVLFLDEFEADSFSDLDEFESLSWLVDAKEQVGGQSVNCHQVVKISFDGFIELANNCLSCVDGFQASLVLALL